MHLNIKERYREIFVHYTYKLNNFHVLSQYFTVCVCVCVCVCVYRDMITTKTSFQNKNKTTREIDRLKLHLIGKFLMASSSNFWVTCMQGYNHMKAFPIRLDSMLYGHYIHIAINFVNPPLIHVSPFENQYNSLQVRVIHL